MGARALAPAIATAAFLATLAVNWPDLPYGIRLPDLLFLPAALATLALVRPWPMRARALDVLVIAYLAGSLPSFLVARDAAAAMEWLRHVYLAGVYAVVAIVVAGGSARLAWGSAVGGAVALASIGVVFAILDPVFGWNVPLLGERMTVPYLGSVLRLRSLTASPAMLACLLTLAMPLAVVALVTRPGHARYWWAACAVTVVAAVLTVSHALAGFVAAAVLVAWPLLRSFRMRRTIAAAVAVTAVIAFNVAVSVSIRSIQGGSFSVADSGVFHHTVETRRTSVGPVTVEYDVLGYARVKALAFSTFLTHPWTGIGLDRFHEVTAEAHRQGRLPAVYSAIDPHSALFGRLAETGVVGGLTLVVLWGGMIAAGWPLMSGTSTHAWIARALTAGLIGLAINSANVDIMNFRFLWAGLGIVRGLRHASET